LKEALIYCSQNGYSPFVFIAWVDGSAVKIDDDSDKLLRVKNATRHMRQSDRLLNSCEIKLTLEMW
jgi:hypothetical protein